MVPAFVRMGDIHLVGDDIREIWSEAGNAASMTSERRWGYSCWGCQNPETAGK